MDTSKEEIRTGKIAEYAKKSKPREIENDIRGTRHKMDELIDKVSERLTPRHLLDEALRAARKPENQEALMRKARSAGRSTVAAFKENPIPAVLMGAGAAWLLYNQSKDKFGGMPQYDSEYPDFYDGNDDIGGEPATDWRPGGRMEESLSKGRQIKEKVKEKLTEGKEKAYQKGSNLAYSAKDKAESWARRGLEKSGESAYRALHNHPLILGVAALAAGVFLGTAIPESRKEQEVLGDASENLKKRAYDKGEEVYAKGKKVVRTVAEETSQQAGDILEKAKQAGESVT